MGADTSSLRGAGSRKRAVRRRIEMCEAHAFILLGEREVKLLESVDELEVHGEEIRLINIFGEQKIIRGKFRSYNNPERKIVLEPLE